MPRRPLLVIFSLAGLVATTASVATAQAVVSAPNTLEFGIDAGAVFGLGDVSTVQITLPAARARVGFFLNNDSRWSIEPAAFFSYSKVEELDGIFVYDIEVGASLSLPATLRSLAGYSHVRDVPPAVHRHHGRLGRG